MRKQLFWLVLLLACCPLAGNSWGVLGHRAIGEIASRHLTPQARVQVERLLGHETLALVSVWPDEVRPYPEFIEYSRWHYLNVETGLAQEQFLTRLRNLPSDPADAFSALRQLLKTLADPAAADADKVFALKFVVHLVGDVHQPLHVGHAEDKGGNDIKVTWRGKETNLHALWDSDIVEYPGHTYLELATLYDTATPTQIAQWQQDDMALWFWESYDAVIGIYAEAATNPAFTYTYYPKHSQLVRARILRAGIRLAGVLNAAFAG